MNSLCFVDCSQGMSVYAACVAYSQETTTMEQHVYVVFPNTCVKRKPLNAFTAVVKDAPVAINLSDCFLHHYPSLDVFYIFVKSGLCTP